MSIPFFLYRRLARWITCEFKLSANAKLALTNKYEIASFNDVFCHPFYWQVFRWLEHSPKLVIDCGAHCGHFTILTDICCRSKFQETNTQYVLIEPNPYLLTILRKNIANTDLSSRTDIQQALLGAKSGYGTLWINHKNYLTASSQPTSNLQRHDVPFADLKTIVGDRSIDLMKIDIEGGEFEFVKSNLDVLSQANLIFIELHDAPEEKHQELFTALKSIDLHLADIPLKANGQQLMVFQRWIPLPQNQLDYDAKRVASI